MSLCAATYLSTLSGPEYCVFTNYTYAGPKDMGIIPLIFWPHVCIVSNTHEVEPSQPFLVSSRNAPQRCVTTLKTKRLQGRLT